MELDHEQDVHVADDEEAQDLSALLTKEELDDLDDPFSAPAQVSYSGQDFDIYGLVRRLEKGDIVVPQFGMQDEDIETAGFQRGFVWNRSQMDRFIESLLLGFPIPGVFLVRQGDGRMLVLDGQQRLRTLQYFYDGMFRDRAYSLQYVADEFVGLAYKSLPDAQRRLIDDSFIQATIVTARPEVNDMRAIYQIFERLNSGGTQLTAHEIRVALYAGPVIDFLETLNVSPDWRELYGRKNPRIRDQELIARILAFYAKWEEYSRPLKHFINNFLSDNFPAVDASSRRHGELFLQAAEKLNRTIGREALRRASRQVNNAWTDALFVGLMTRIESADIDDSRVIVAYERLRDDPDYQTWTAGSSADEDRVHSRMARAIEVFSEA